MPSAWVRSAVGRQLVFPSYSHTLSAAAVLASVTTDGSTTWCDRDVTRDNSVVAVFFCVEEPPAVKRAATSSSSRPIVSGTLKKMNTIAETAMALKDAHNSVGPRPSSSEMKEIETMPASIRVIKRASDMALARSRLGKTSVPTTYTKGEKPRENEPMIPQTPTTDSQLRLIEYEADTTPNEAASPNAEMRSIGRRPRRSKSCDAKRRHSTLQPPAPIVATKAS
mmetsp:Transcript_7160/g.22125  ORF Transcript_7160/g.22125 Transcript_7160/m.22125 type:complete len:224 (-) Transcript_7160:975-1646(-)